MGEVMAMLEKATAAKVNKLIVEVCDVALEQTANNEFPKENIEAVARLIESLNSGNIERCPAIGFIAESEESDDG